MTSGSSSSCSFHFLRLISGQDVRSSLLRFCAENKITAGSIVSAVGSLKKVKIRKADSNSFYESPEPHELLTLSGLISSEGVHIHISVANKEASVFGGHLSEGNQVHTTLELVIAAYSGKKFLRVLDPQTGYPELLIE